MEDKSVSERERRIFAKNFNYWLDVRGKLKVDVANDLGFSTAIVSEWALGNKYPRVGNMQRVADYLGILMSDLREERKPAVTSDDELSDEEWDLIRRYRAASEEAKRIIDKIV